MGIGIIVTLIVVVVAIIYFIGAETRDKLIGAIGLGVLLMLVGLEGTGIFTGSHESPAHEHEHHELETYHEETPEETEEVPEEEYGGYEEYGEEGEKEEYY